jgi:probable HAF family extracellular repeat protein
MVGLGDLPGGRFDSVATDVSADGSIVVGVSNFEISYNPSGGGVEAFRWTAESGMVGIGFMEGMTMSNGWATSADANVIVGMGNGPVAIRWSAASGFSEVGQRPEPVRTSTSYAVDVSADGNVVAANMVTGGVPPEGFLWTPEDGMTRLGPWSHVVALSDDGEAVIGRNGLAASRWTARDGWIDLGVLPGSPRTEAMALSADGSIVVGTSEGVSNNDRAFLWTRSTSLLDLREYLLAQGVSAVEGWRLTSAQGISANGRTIVGTGYSPLGERDYWIVTIPEPHTISLAVVAMLGAIGLSLRACRRS